MAGRDFKGSINSASFVTRFNCLGDTCEDTCCRGWGMQVDQLTRQIYEKEAPELLDALSSGEAELIMKRDPKTDYCVKFTDGLCTVHKDKGTKFLGDACHFYPRITRKLGEEVYMSGTLSCPEIARLTLYGDEKAFDFTAQEIERIPESTKDYKPEGLSDADAKMVMEAFQKMVLSAPTPERALAILVNVAQSLELVDPKNWGQGVPLYLKIAEGRLPKPEEDPMDGYRLINILVALVYAAKKTARPRLEETITRMEKALKVRIDRQGFQVISETGELNAHEEVRARWKKTAEKTLAPVLKNWIAAQLSMASFPFAGFGRNIKERAVILAVRFATLRLALMAHVKEDGTPPQEEEVVKVAQSLSRFLDHLADPTFSMMAYDEVGWAKEPRLRGLLGDM